jgi:hypothetical protein
VADQGAGTDHSDKRSSPSKLAMLPGLFEKTSSIRTVPAIGVIILSSIVPELRKSCIFGAFEGTFRILVNTTIDILTGPLQLS